MPMSNIAIAARQLARKPVGQRPICNHRKRRRGNGRTLAWLDRDKLYQTIAGKRAKAQASKTGEPTLLVKKGTRF